MLRRTYSIKVILKVNAFCYTFLDNLSLDNPFILDGYDVLGKYESMKQQIEDDYRHILGSNDEVL